MSGMNPPPPEIPEDVHDKEITDLWRKHYAEEQAWLQHYAAQDMESRVARLERVSLELTTQIRSIDRGWGKRLNDLRIRLDGQFETLARKAWQAVEDIKAKHQ